MSYALTYTSGGNTIEFGPGKPFVLKAFSDPSAQSIRFSTSNGAYNIGDKIENQAVESKTFAFAGTIIGVAQRHKDLLLRTVAPMQKGILTYNGALSIEVYPKITPSIEKFAVNPMFTFTLYAPYPFWRTAEEKADEIVGLTKIFKFPWNISVPYRFSEYSAASYISVINDGTVPSRWRAEFYAGAPMSRPRIENMITGAYVQINKDMEIGEKIIIDTTGQELTVTGVSLEGEERSLFEYLDIDSNPFELMVGDNLVRGSATSGGANLRAKIYHHDYFSGVDII